MNITTKANNHYPWLKMEIECDSTKINCDVNNDECANMAVDLLSSARDCIDQSNNPKIEHLMDELDSIIENLETIKQ